MANQKSTQLNPNAVKIMNFCNMLNNSTSSAVEYFKQAKQKNVRQTPIVKKRIFERHYFNDVVYINPNMDSMLQKIEKVNGNTARKIRDFIYGLTM